MRSFCRISKKSSLNILKQPLKKTITLELKKARLQSVSKETHHQPHPTSPPNTNFNTQVPITSKETTTPDTAAMLPRKRKKTQPDNYQPQKTDNNNPFFRKKPKKTTKYHLTTVTPTQVNDPIVHNFSSFYITTHHINLLNKGLSFSPHQLFNTKDHSNILTLFDTFSVSLRNIALKPFHTTEPETNQPTTDTTFLFRRIKFLKAETAKDQLLYITNNDSLENFIASTNIIIDSQLRKKPSRKKKRNISKKELKAIRDLKHTRVVIKPADKNLGIAVLNTEDYIDQCLTPLSTNTYTRTGVFPSNQVKYL